MLLNFWLTSMFTPRSFDQNVVYLTLFETPKLTVNQTTFLERSHSFLQTNGEAEWCKWLGAGG